MKQISLIVGVFLAVLAHSAMAQDDQTIAQVCAGDAARLCQVPIPRIEDFRKQDGIIYSCLKGYLGSSKLSRPCWDELMKY
jgi:hypothetical protein